MTTDQLIKEVKKLVQKTIGSNLFIVKYTTTTDYNITAISIRYLPIKDLNFESYINISEYWYNIIRRDILDPDVFFGADIINISVRADILNNCQTRDMLNRSKNLSSEEENSLRRHLLEQS